jgi:CheY-like chemotaxis protein
VAKILVADDNSNIQKMVGLALKDQGIDVVAVGNGEAAVRKISDLRPDLVLADVFMPVRNGYEVCQYVKTDPSLAHIPVILLVGAFDPLDEQEAQRVGADGVLKKPFVPPDPLISMVKSALQRAGVAHGGAGAVKIPEPAALKGTDLLTPSAAPVSIPTLSSIPMHTAFPEPVIAALDQESFVDEVPARPEPVQIDSGSQPVAFGSLLETPADEKDDELGFLPQAHPDLAPERDWRDTDAEELDEEAEEEKPAAPWRREEAESYADSGTASGAKDWRSGSFEQILARKAHSESWEPAEEKPEVVETAPAASNHVAEVPAAPASIPELTGAISSTPFATDAWAAVSPPASQEKISTKTTVAVEEVPPAKEGKTSLSEAVVESVPAGAQGDVQANTSKESWFSVPSNPWNTELEKANRLASAWDSGAPVSAAAASGNGTEKAAEPVGDTTQKVIEEAALPAATVEAIREEAAHVAEDATHIPEQQSYDGAGFYAQEEEIETPALTPTSASTPTLDSTPAPASTPSMDDLVAKVLAQMNPEMLQAVTREILKPVVEAMVKEELKSKKP